MVDLKMWKKWGFFDTKSGFVDPYLVLEETCEKPQSLQLSNSEWKTLATIFKRHPELIKIWAPNRDPEPERTPFTYSPPLKRIVIGEDVDRKYILYVQNKKAK